MADPLTSMLGALKPVASTPRSQPARTIAPRPLTPVHLAATVGDLEKLIRTLKRSGEITSATKLSSIDVDGGTTGKGPVEVRVFKPGDPASDDHGLAIWGDYA